MDGPNGMVSIIPRLRTLAGAYGTNRRLIFSCTRRSPPRSNCDGKERAFNKGLGG